MKNIPFTISMMVISLMLAGKMARAQGSVEVMCRSKAKEIALQTYQNCVTEEKTSRLQDLKSRYKARMSEVKDEFQRELDEINGKQAAAKAPKKTTKAVKPAVKAVKTSKAARAEQPVAGIATTLPAKQNDNGPAEPVQTDSGEQAVIASAPTATPAEETVPDAEIIEMSEQ